MWAGWAPGLGWRPPGQRKKALKWGENVSRMGVDSASVCPLRAGGSPGHTSIPKERGIWFWGSGTSLPLPPHLLTAPVMQQGPGLKNGTKT